MRDITLQDVTSTGGLNPYAGVLICNVSNPCEKIVFERVLVQQGVRDGVDKTLPFIVQEVHGSAIDTTPSVEFLV